MAELSSRAVVSHCQCQSRTQSTNTFPVEPYAVGAPQQVFVFPEVNMIDSGPPLSLVASVPIRTPS